MSTASNSLKGLIKFLMQNKAAILNAVVMKILKVNFSWSLLLFIKK